MNSGQLESKAEKYAYDFHIRQHETGRSKSVYEVYIDGFNDGYDEGFKDCAKARLNVTTISDCPILGDFVVHYEHGIYKYKDKSGREFESVDGETWKEIVCPKEQERT